MNRRSFFLSALALAAFPASAAAEMTNARYNFQGRAWRTPGRQAPQAWGPPLAWRVMAAGYRVHYTGAPGVLHPPPPDGQVRARHPGWLYHGARNRVWLARRYLPLPLGTVYVLSFAARAIPRLRSRERVREWARGYRDGLREPCGPRRPLPAATLWRMTRLGRPPIV